MTELLLAREQSRSSRPLHAEMAIWSVVDDSVFATRFNELLLFMRVTGSDGETLGDSVKADMARRLERALHTLPHSWNLWVYEAKTPVSGSLAHNGKQLFKIETIVAISRKGWNSNQSLPRRDWRKMLSRSFSVRKQDDANYIHLRSACEVLRGAAQAFASHLQDFASAEILNAPEAFRVLRGIVNPPEKADVLPLASPHGVDRQLCSSTVEAYPDYLRLDGQYLSVLSLVDLPSRTYADIFSTLKELKTSYALTTYWRPETPARSHSLIRSKQRHFHNAKTALTSETFQTAGRHDPLIDSAALAMVENLGDCHKEIELEGRTLGRCSMTIVIREKDLPSLKDAVYRCLTIFGAKGAHVIEETHYRLGAWFTTFPGNTQWNIRQFWATSANLADVICPFSPDSGEAVDSHLHAPALAVLRSRTDTAYNFSLHRFEVAHTFVVGSSGSGKSFLMNFLLHQAQKYDPQVYVFDLGASYRSLTSLLKGSWCSVGSEHMPFTINPFRLEGTPDNLRFLSAWMAVLIGKNGYRMSVEEEQDLYEQIEAMYTIAPRDRYLQKLVEVLPPRLQKELAIWTGRGAYAHYFNHVEDTLTLAQFQTFNFAGFEKSGDVLECLLFYILHRASTSIHQSPGRLKLFVMDEAWAFLRTPSIRAYIEEALRTWRKLNAAMIVSTQSGDDVLNRDILPVFVENMPTQIFLSNPLIDQKAYARAFHLSEREAEIITDLTPKKEFLLKRPDRSKILQLEVSLEEALLYGNGNKPMSSTELIRK